MHSAPAHKSFTPETAHGTFAKRRTRVKIEGDDDDSELRSVKLFHKGQNKILTLQIVRHFIKVTNIC